MRTGSIAEDSPTLNIEEYRAEVTEHLLQPLVDLGFQAAGDHIYLNREDSCLALLRVRDKWSNLTQQVKYLLVVRQAFLPDLEERPVSGFVEHPALYPFKVNPLKLHLFEKGLFKKRLAYRYVSCNLGHYDTVDIDYGDKFSRNTLTAISAEMSSRALRWFEQLTPKESARQIRTYGNDEYIEKIWLRAYKAHGY